MAMSTKRPMKKSNSCILIVSLLLTVILSVACSRRPSGVLSKEDMAQLMADIYMGESVTEANGRTFATDSSRKAFLQSIYAAHGITREEADSSFSWYGYNLEKYMEVYDRAIEILEKRLEKAEDLAGSSAEGIAEMSTNLQGDSVDVWPGLRWRRFSQTMPNDMITFSMNSDQNWENGDVYTLRSKTYDNKGSVLFNITAEYNDGSFEYVSQKMHGEGWHDLTLALDSARRAQRVFGTISYTPAQGEVAFIDSISLIRARWGGHYRSARNSVNAFANRTQHKVRTDLPAPLTITPVRDKEIKTIDSRQLKPIDDAHVIRPGRLKEKFR